MSGGGSRRAPHYLRHIVHAVERINRYVEDLDRDGFLHDEKTQDAVIRNIEIIGEAAKNVERVSPELTASHPDIPWLVVYAMRNRMSHGYFEVDLDLVWQTVQSDLPVLATQVRGLLRMLDQQSDHQPQDSGSDASL